MLFSSLVYALTDIPLHTNTQKTVDFSPFSWLADFFFFFKNIDKQIFCQINSLSNVLSKSNEPIIFKTTFFFFFGFRNRKKIQKNSSISETLFLPEKWRITFQILPLWLRIKLTKSDAQICSSLVSLIKTQVKR